MRKYKLHIQRGKHLYPYFDDFCPRIGDELRFGPKEFYRVTKVVWCLDEPEAEGTRVNIGTVKIKL